MLGKADFEDETLYSHVEVSGEKEQFRKNTPTR